LQTQTLIAQHLRDAAKLLDSQNVKAKLELRRGDVSTELLQEADEGNFDLIMIGATREQGALQSWFLGSVTREIVNHAKCPVLVVRSQ
jgi:nucleotide-binding universal stress UspA family protein